MENLKKYFEESNLPQSEKEKAFNFVKKLHDGSFMDDEKIYVHFEGREELFYVIGKFKSKEDFAFQRGIGYDVLCCIDNNYEWFSEVYIGLNKISNDIFKVENSLLRRAENIIDEKGRDTGLFKIVFSFDYNQKNYLKETACDCDPVEFIFDAINNFIEVNNLSEKRFLFSYTGDKHHSNHCVVFVDSEQEEIINEYLSHSYL